MIRNQDIILNLDNITNVYNLIKWLWFMNIDRLFVHTWNMKLDLLY